MLQASKLPQVTRVRTIPGALRVSFSDGYCAVFLVGGRSLPCFAGFRLERNGKSKAGCQPTEGAGPELTTNIAEFEPAEVELYCRAAVDYVSSLPEKDQDSTSSRLLVMEAKAIGLRTLVQQALDAVAEAVAPEAEQAALAGSA